MYLKSLELQGFKSFPDKIKLSFDRGLTAIVGPNGSGKSNISDAVRWVLGEQSTKTLRSNKMEDVIFSGTVGRKPTGFASVTLVIDNSENRLEGYEQEVNVTRKLYRSGDSEYRINGKAVRLKDINELFMDTGLGRDGYSLIGQGRISEIVGAKSNERREIFEEAAGISKFRYRKSEAERRLAQVQEKMERVQDIFSELENRIEPLRLQSEKAQKFLILAEEEKKLEVSVWIQQLNDLQENLKNLQEILLINQTEYENIKLDITSEELKIQTCYQNIQAYSAKAEETHAYVKNLQEQILQAKSDIAVWENDKIHSQEALQVLKNRHKQGLQELNCLLSELKQAEEKNLKIQELFITTRQALANAEQEFQKMEENFQIKDETAKQADENLHALYLQRSELQFAIRSAEEKKEQFLTEIANLEIEINSNIQDLQQAEKIYQDSFFITQDLQNQVLIQEQKLADFQKNAQESKTKEEQAEELLKQFRFQLQDKKQRHKILTDLENNLEGFSGSAKAIMRYVKQNHLNYIFGSVAQLIQVDSKFSIAIETALGASVQHLVVADENAAKAGIKFLRDNKAGRATFLPLTTTKSRYISQQDLESLSNIAGFIAIASDLVTCESSYKQIVENLLGKIIIAENLDTGAVIAKTCHFKFRIVTIDGQVIHAGGSFTGGSVQKTGGMLTRKTEIHALQEEIKQLALQCQEAEKHAITCAEQAAEYEKILKLETENFNLLKQNFLQAQNKTEQLAFPVSQFQKQMQVYSEHMENLKIKSAQANHALDNAKLAYEKKLQEIALAEISIADLKKSRMIMQQEHEQISENYHNLKIYFAQVEKDRESSAYALQQLQDSVQKAKQTEEKYILESKYYQNEIAEKSKLIQEREIFLADIEKKIINSEQEAKFFTKKHDEQYIKIQDLQSDLNAYHATKEKLSTEITRLSERELNLKSEHDKIIEKLFEIYELTRSEAQAMAEPVTDILFAKKKLSDLKQKIRALGSVNLDSLAEYQEVSERYALYAKEMTDIKKSRHALEKMIEELTQEMCRIFSESFVIINQNFKKIFRDLFGGGHAELILTEPEHVLDSGIEIKVSPTGKIIKNLISLSGGEQSFVAIAIYFAILKLRPAPFCILDEIDAALDEANVRKYARYIRNFINHTQFVLVTHRRSAMEEANVLYGVTMQEDGISRLLKLEQPEDENY
ncbi:MAG: chromosome segregation protein SMC [Ruminococcus sp.]|nr:chromosome segregation protein SMC [Ruminococcus sp.]